MLDVLGRVKREGYHRLKVSRTGLESLTPMQVESIEAVIAHPSQLAASRALNISYQTLKNHLNDARRRLGTESTLQSCVVWDRHRRAQSWPRVERRIGERRSGADRRTA